jgi:uncharacterized membrane protein HdeD (DUF308 family)
VYFVHSINNSWVYTENKEKTMATDAKEYAEGLWWLYVLEGIVAIAFGVIALFLPGLTLAALVIMFALYVIIIGIIELTHGFNAMGRNNSWWFSVVVGIVLLGVGLYLFRNLSIALNAFIVLIGAFVLVRGFIDLVTASFFSQRDETRWLFAISGTLGIIAGIILWISPVAAGLAFVWALGLYALITGTIHLVYAFKVRGAFNEIEDIVEKVVNNKPARSARSHR